MEFRLSEEGIKKIQTKAITSGAVSFAYLALVMLITMYAGEYNPFASMNFEVFMFMLVSAVLQCWVIYKTVTSFRTCVVSIEEGQITRQQRGLTDVLIWQYQLKSIDCSNSGYCRVTASTGQELSIPPGMENEAEMRVLLQSMMPITHNELPFWKKNAKMMFRVFTLVCLYIYYAYRHTQFSGAVELALFGYMCIVALLGLQFGGKSKIMKIALWIVFAIGAGNFLVQLLNLLNQ